MKLKGAGQAVRQIANRTFYRRGEQWVDSQVTEAQEQNAHRFKQFSDERVFRPGAGGRTR